MNDMAKAFRPNQKTCMKLSAGIILSALLMFFVFPGLSYADELQQEIAANEEDVLDIQAAAEQDAETIDTSQAAKVAAESKAESATSEINQAFKNDSNDSLSATSDDIQLAATAAAEPTVSYQTHVENIGWQDEVSNGDTAGTVGQALRLEGIKIKISAGGYTGGIEYQTQIQDIGWEKNWAQDGAMSGTTGQAKRLETIRVMLTGDIKNFYHVYYRVHCQDLGWMDWACDGGDAGSVGVSKRLEAIEIKLYRKGSVVPSDTATPSYEPYIGYTSHVENIGWQDEVFDGASAGTTGQALRVEALHVRLVEENSGHSGSILYNVHVQDYGWMNEVSNNAIAGTTGEAKRIEAITVRLDGDIAKYFNVYYRVHVENIGWMGWAEDGAAAGTSARALRVEAVEIKLVKIGDAAPRSTDNAYQDGSVASASSIMGASQTNVDQMVRYYNSKGKTYPSSALASKGAGDIRTFSQILIEESNSEGVRAEVVFCQAMLESAWLEFGGAVQAYQCNFSGLGAIDSDPVRNSYTYADVRAGLRAQVQHLKAYASSAALANPVVSASNAYHSYIADGSRYYVVGDVYGFGCAPTLEDLSEKWASGSTYGQDIRKLVDGLLAA